MESTLAATRDVDFGDTAFLERPWPPLIRLANEEPVFWSAKQQGWIITGHDNVKKAYADKRFSAKRVDLFFRGLPSEVVDQLSAIRKYYSINVNRLDGPDHIRIRTLMLKAFNKSAITPHEQAVDNLIGAILDECEQAGTFDFCQLVGSILPTSVIQLLLDIPDDMRSALFDLASAITRATAAPVPTPSLMYQMEHAIRTLNDVFNALIAERTQTPGVDLISTLVHARDGLKKLDHDELLACFHAIIVAGTETTAHSLGSGLAQIARSQELQAHVRQGEHAAGTLALELLRYPGTVKCMTRIAGEDFEFGGKAIRKGDICWIMNASANVDDAVFADPFSICPDRDNRDSMAFGPGLHHCVGHLLARMELSKFFARTFQRFDVEVLPSHLEMQPSYVFYGYKSLHVRFATRNQS